MHDSDSKWLVLPSQILPSPINPGRQEQVKLPGRLLHSAVEEQSFSISNKHSLMSRKQDADMC